MVKQVRTWWAPAVAMAIVVVVGAAPFVTHSNAVPPWLRSAEQTSPVPVTTTIPTASIPPVTLSEIATPDQPNDLPAPAPNFDASREASLVAGEDLRLRTLLHHISRLTFPVVVPVDSEYDLAAGVTRAGMPTLVLPGPATYTIDDLLANEAVIPLSQGGYILEDNVLVAAGATLKLSSSDVPLLLMDSSDAGFTSLVTWGGVLSLSGTSDKSPLVIIGWNKALNAPAVDHGYGRPYIRAVGGELDLKYVHVSNLGFWSGRTGGVAWTGINSKASTGSAISSRFFHNAYGAFVSRSLGVQFTDDLFELNSLDGLRLHRLATGSVVTKSAAARNAGNGFVVSRSATGNVLADDLAVNNAGNGFLLNGLPLVNGASPSGSGTTASEGTVIEHSDAEGNLKTGILVEGGTGTIVKNNIVCGAVTGIAIRLGAVDTWIMGNEIRCGGRVALSIGPAVTGTTIDGNVLSHARIGLLIRNSPGVRIFYNTISDVDVFGISVRGTSQGVVGNDNVISGRGFQPIDTRGGAETPTMTNTNLTGWQHRSSLNVLASWRYHPLLTAWVVIILILASFTIAFHFRERPARPYMYGVPWRTAGEYATWAAPAPVPAATAAAAEAAPAPVPVLVPEHAVATAETQPLATPHVLWQPFALDAPAPPAPANGKKRSAKTAAAAAPAPEPKPDAAPEQVASDVKEELGQFWRVLAAGTWAGEEGRPPKLADQEATA